MGRRGLGSVAQLAVLAAPGGDTGRVAGVFGAGIRSSVVRPAELSSVGASLTGGSSGCGIVAGAVGVRRGFAGLCSVGACAFIPYRASCAGFTGGTRYKSSSPGFTSWMSRVRSNAAFCPRPDTSRGPLRHLSSADRVGSRRNVEELQQPSVQPRIHRRVHHRVDQCLLTGADLTDQPGRLCEPRQQLSVGQEPRHRPVKQCRRPLVGPRTRPAVYCRRARSQSSAAAVRDGGPAPSLRRGRQLDAPGASTWPG